jgi:hypothetical protein
MTRKFYLFVITPLVDESNANVPPPATAATAAATKAIGDDKAKSEGDDKVPSPTANAKVSSAAASAPDVSTTTKATGRDKGKSKGTDEGGKKTGGKKK